MFVFSAEAAEEWKEHKTRHFIVFYNDAPFDFVEAVESNAERFYVDIYEDMRFGRPPSWSYDERVKIYIYDSQDDYIKERNVAWSHGVASPSEKIIRTFPRAHGFFDSTLPHELGHIIFRDFIGYRVRVPSWFEEGIAMYQEQAKRFGAHHSVKDALKQNKFIPVPKLNSMFLTRRTDKDTVNLFYAESASLVNYIITEHGKNRFIRFCRKLREGKEFHAAFQSTFVRFRSYKKLNKMWVAYVLEQ